MHMAHPLFAFSDDKHISLSPMLAVFTLLLRGAQYSAAPANATQPLQLLQLTAHPQARCMDGTAGGFYVHMSRLGAAQTKWLLTLQGGGECVSAKCAAKAKSALGSSDHFPGSYEFWDEAKAHFADTSCTANPELCDYNQVFLPYCSQDLWTGQATRPSPANSSAPGWYFSGHLILGAVLDELVASHGLGRATQIVLSGESAGGFGVYHNVDWLAARFPAARVVGAVPDAAANLGLEIQRRPPRQGAREKIRRVRRPAGRRPASYLIIINVIVMCCQSADITAVSNR